MRAKSALKMFSILALSVAPLATLPTALAQSGPDRIVIEQEGLFPGGVVYDADGGRFLVSSRAGGTIFAVADDGTATPFIQDETLTSASAMHIDAATHTLYVVSSDAGGFGFGMSGPRAEGTPFEGTPPFELPPGSTPEPGQLPAGTPEPGQRPAGFPEDFNPSTSVLAYDLATGTRLRTVDLMGVAPGSPHLGSDVTTDAAGNVYVTDSLGGVVYMVDPAGSTFYLQLDALGDQSYGLSGIAYHPDGFLIVAQAMQGTLWKIPLDNPANVTQVALAEAHVGMNSIMFDAAGNLIVVTGGRAESASVLVLRSDDGWASAAVDRQVAVEPGATTGVLRDGDVYLVYGGNRPVGSDAAAASGGPAATGTTELVRVNFAA
jgi:sugar lactone lactonase YvrE